MTKKFVLLNLMPIVVTDAIVLVITAFFTSEFFVSLQWVLIMGQIVAVPVYFLIILAVYVFKHKFSIIKGFAIQLLTILAAPYILLFMAGFYGLIVMEATIPELVESVVEFGFGAFGILLMLMPVMLPGTLIIALVSHIRKKKAENREQ